MLNYQRVLAKNIHIPQIQAEQKVQIVPTIHENAGYVLVPITFSLDWLKGTSRSKIYRKTWFTHVDSIKYRSFLTNFP